MVRAARGAVVIRRALVLVLALAMPLGCRPRVPAGSADSDATAMGHWDEWRDLSPLVEIARTHAPQSAADAIDRASALLRENKAASADRALAVVSGGAGHHWIAVARADVVALHFSLCIRGVALRIEDGARPSATDRKADFSENTRVEPGDVSVEATLVNLDAAVSSGEPALATQARIARARVAAFAQQCAANQNVGEMAQQVVESDLATLAAEGHLTPDLAYLWAGVQMTRFSGSAARPFLLQAKEGGFDHPAVTFMLAAIALEQRELDQADEYAKAAAAVYVETGDVEHQAEVRFLQGEIARARKQPKAARTHYEAALAIDATHSASILARAELDIAADEETAILGLQRGLKALLLEGALDETTARVAATNVEQLLVLALEPHQIQLVRDALLQRIDDESDAMRRGLRYFFAAMLDVRLREYQVAHGHGVLAKEEFATSGVRPPIDIEAFLGKLREG
jgi:tetratricopeptide (TPR) repeat protein